MIDMIIKMSLVTALYVALTAGLWLVLRRNKNRMRIRERVFVGVVYGICAILSTHFGVDYESMVLNVRDIAPLAAGLFFDPISGIIAGLVGGIERYIAGEYFGVGAYTRIACSVSTCLAGFLAAGLNVKIFKGKKPSPFYAFFMGAVMEVFHMYVVFITHRNDMTRAFYVVDTCSIPMIVFTGIGMAASAAVLLLLAGEVKFGLRKPNEEELPISVRFQAWLFIYTMIMLVATFSFSFSVQSRTVLQNAQNTMEINTNDAKQEYIYVKENNKIVNEILQDSGYKDPEITEKLNRLKNIGKNLENRRIGENGKIYIADSRGIVIIGEETGKTLIELGLNETQMNTENGFFMTNILDEESYCRIEKIYDGAIFLTVLPAVEVYSSRNSAAYETAFADILLFAVVFVLIYILVQKIVVNNLDRINASLARITQGQLDEVVDVKSSSEFASLSNDINLTVSALKGYIEQAEKRIEEELRFAKEIQSSALPKVFKFPKRNEFELYATMNPAKEVGGDFYDFFFIDNHQIAFVIADVSGKGIPASLFMMRSKTAIKSLAETGRSPSEIFSRANDALCEGNDADMFVTAWIGILDIDTGIMRCANAGHEYPALKRANGEWELFKDKHALALAAMEGMPFAEYEIKLEKGDRIFVYTDGVAEATDSKNELFGAERMIDALNNNKELAAQELLVAMKRDIDKFVGEAPQFDDITMLSVTYFGKEE